jgi:hypothetical protein
MVERAIRLEKKPKDEGPERPADESQVGVTYVNYEDLQPISAELLSNSESYFASLRELAHSDDWKAQYDAVNSLRQLSKFNHELLISHLSLFGEFLKT